MVHKEHVLWSTGSNEILMTIIYHNITTPPSSTALKVTILFIKITYSKQFI